MKDIGIMVMVDRAALVIDVSVIDHRHGWDTN